MAVVKSQHATPPTICCRKSELRLSWLYERSPRFHIPRSPGSRLRATSVGGEIALKNPWTKIARNPLISLVSDERIQGNPRKSNTLNKGNSLRNGQGQENPHLPRLFPAALVALAPIADRPAFVLEPPPFAPRVGERRLVPPVEHENDEIERVVSRAGFDAGKPDQHGRGVGVLQFAGQKDRLGHRIAVAGRAMGKKARVVVGPQPFVESGDHLVGRSAHENAPAFLQRTLEQAWQTLIDASLLQMIEPDFRHWPAGPTMTKVRSEPVAISPRLTPPGACSSVLPAT